MNIIFADFLENIYQSILIIYASFMIVFIIFETYIRVSRTCYKPFAWNVIVYFANIGFLSIFLCQFYNVFLSKSIVLFIYILLIFHFARSLINELLIRYFKK
jgi:hypothetical protein